MSNNTDKDRHIASSKSPDAATADMEHFVGKFRLLDGQGPEGLNKQIALWVENKKRLTTPQFDRCTVALGLPDSRPSGVMMERLACRFARVQAVLPEEFGDWAVLTVLTFLDDRSFERLLHTCLGMTPLFANELLKAITEVPLADRLQSRTEPDKQAYRGNESRE